MKQPFPRLPRPPRASVQRFHHLPVSTEISVPYRKGTRILLLEHHYWTMNPTRPFFFALCSSQPIRHQQPPDRTNRLCPKVHQRWWILMRTSTFRTVWCDLYIVVMTKSQSRSIPYLFLSFAESFFLLVDWTSCTGKSKLGRAWPDRFSTKLKLNDI